MVACSGGSDAVTSMLSAVESVPCRIPLVMVTEALPVAEAAKVPETDPLPKAARLTMSPRSMSIDESQSESPRLVQYREIVRKTIYRERRCRIIVVAYDPCDVLIPAARHSVLFFTGG